MEANFKHTRLLAAVMFVDIVGYTAIMQKNEREAVRMRSLLRLVIERQLPQHEGRLVQYYGDGALGFFKSAMEAVNAAVKIQDELKKHTVPVRIGLHQGEIVHTREGIYGSAVNIASRIEALAQAGSILISEKIYVEIQNQTDLKFREAGNFGLKNVDGPLKLYSLTDTTAAPFREEIMKRWQHLKFLQVRTALVRPYLSNTNPALLN
jgi:class 3 adenylate cyclase